ncbi:MAG: phosphoenolpyruvate carboxykinase (ATP) [Anaerolineales bacterium]|nr:phosphoenolpyruvate carboxykinase (ATP) [Anaerolineales bacterium]MDW8227787.1 phosphoenolpyruvate carboxykinase (ATP) [Anaerolineales bacterium]
MNNILNIKTPTEGQAAAIRSDYGLDYLGLTNLRKVYWNLPTEALYEEIIFRGEASIAHLGPIVVHTGKHTARAANDKFVVREPENEDKIWWGQYNRPFAPDKFDELFARLQGYLQGRDVFVQDVYGGADPQYRLPVRIVTELAWHSLFARNMFIKPQTAEEYRRFVPEFTVISVPGFKAFSPIDQTPTETFIALNFAQRLCIIGNTGYGGEIKKSVFTLLNYLLPLHHNVLTMHCSANLGQNGDVALFFGLSGTGKTTLSADPKRRLIGDDEHGWSDNGIFNFEDGCYAKVIELSPSAEPQIYAATRRFGTVLENVVYDPVTRFIDLDDASITENTRAAYPLTFIENAVPEKRGGHPKNIIFLTCDASGVMPPIARLTTEQAMYHFISGYTSKIAGTEIGLRDEPEITFSACFGGPFMVHPPAFYAELLRRKIERYGVKCWLVNTGWVGGPYGVGKRISIRHTRNLLNAALEGLLDQVEYYTDPIFGFQVPKTCPDVPEDVLYPERSWQHKEEYWKRYRQLASRFMDNMKKFETTTPRDVIEAGPKLG